MNVTLILWTSFISLVGLQLCTINNSNDQYINNVVEQVWTTNPRLRVFYGLSNILGVIFVLGMVGYLCIKEHWWYFFVYFGGLLVARIIASLLTIVLIPLYNLSHDIPTFARIKVQRIVGSVIILIGIFCFLLGL